MSTKRFVILATSLTALVVSTFIAWYEGAQIYDNPWEWGNTALVSNYLNGYPITTEGQIVMLDHFIYAAKFQPLFPLLMVVSLLAFILVSVYPLVKRNRNVLLATTFFLASISFIVFFLLGNSPTPGFKLFTALFGFIGLLSMGILLSVVIKVKRNSLVSE